MPPAIAATPQPVLGRAAPGVADGQRQGVGGVGRLGRRRQAQHAGDHQGDLLLVRAAVAGDGGLDLAGGVPGDRPVGLGGGERGDPGGLRGAHGRALVVLGEDPLDRHDVRPVLAQQRGHGGVQLQQAQLQVELGHRADHADADRGGPGAGAPVDHAPPAPGEARVDAEHPHEVPPSQPNACSTEANRPDRRDRVTTRRSARQGPPEPASGGQRGPSSADLLEHLVGHVVVRVHVLHVVAVLEGVDQAEDLAGVRPRRARR